MFTIYNETYLLTLLYLVRVHVFCCGKVTRLQSCSVVVSTSALVPGDQVYTICLMIQITSLKLEKQSLIVCDSLTVKIEPTVYCLIV